MTRESRLTQDEAEAFTSALGQVVAGSWRLSRQAWQLGVPQALGMSHEEWVSEKLGGYVRLSIPERREAVQELTEAGMSTREIGAVLGVDNSTVHGDRKALEGDTKEQPVENPTLTPHPVETPELPEGQYRCIVIDPPWPMQKIVREVRPNQTKDLDYTTLEIPEIDKLVGEVVNAQDNAHIYLWTTQRFLPAGLSLFESWGVKYQCVMTWVKNVGPTPFSWMYDTEHVLFGQRGSVPLHEKGLRLSFQAKVDGHSRKPAVFYQRVLAASPGPRLAMFERGDRDGFEVWGAEVAA